MPVSLKMDNIEYRAVIKLFVKEGLTPKEIHSKFIKVYSSGVRNGFQFLYFVKMRAINLIIIVIIIINIQERSVARMRRDLTL